MELFEQIRREYEFGVGTIAGVSRKLGVHRRMVREALSSAVPAESKPQQRKLRKLEAASAFIDRILTADRQAPAKQRHTARRIWQRLCAELPGFSGSERSVRGYVRRRRQQLGLVGREVFVPQSYEWGVEAQVDWYEAWAVLGGERIKLQVFEMRSMASGAAYHRAYTHATQQAFLEAHELAFRLLWRRLPAAPLRQPEERGEEDPARLSPRGDQPLHCLPFALAVSERVLQPGTRQREGWRGRRRWILPAQPLGAVAASPRSGRAERVSGTVLPPGSAAHSGGPQRDRRSGHAP